MIKKLPPPPFKAPIIQLYKDVNLKIRFILVLLIFLTIGGNAQNLVPIGAKWYYNIPYSSEGGYILLEAVKDSVINNQNVMVIAIKHNGNEFICNEYIHQDEDKVYYHNHINNTFHLLYDYSAQPGDTIFVHSSEFTPNQGFLCSFCNTLPGFIYKIISNEIIMIDGKSLRMQRIENISDPWGFFPSEFSEITIIEGIGSLIYFFGKGNFITPEDNNSLLRCYMDNEIYYQNPAWNNDCDLIVTIPEVPIIELCRFILTNGGQNIRIEAKETIESVCLYNISAGLIFADTPCKQTYEMCLSPFANCIYILKVSTKKSVYFKKLIKSQY